MSEFKGTKGQWGYELKLNNGYINLLADNAEIKLAEIIVNPFSEIGEDEAISNALLISKAPEMLEILIELEMIMDKDLNPTEMHSKIQNN